MKSQQWDWCLAWLLRTGAQCNLQSLRCMLSFNQWFRFCFSLFVWPFYCQSSLLLLKDNQGYNFHSVVLKVITAELPVSIFFSCIIFSTHMYYLTEYNILPYLCQSLYVHIPSRHPYSYSELELPTLLQVCMWLSTNINSRLVTVSLSMPWSKVYEAVLLDNTCIEISRFWPCILFPFPVSSSNVLGTSLWRISTSTNNADTFGIFWDFF